MPGPKGPNREEAQGVDIVTTGVYFLYDADEIVYIGESDNVFRRIGQHIAEGKKIFDHFEIYPTPDRKRLEGFLIRALQPKYNRSHGVDGSFYLDDFFPTMTAKETIEKYRNYEKDVRIKQVAEDIGLDAGFILGNLVSMSAPVYKIDGS